MLSNEIKLQVFIILKQKNKYIPKRLSFIGEKKTTVADKSFIFLEKKSINKTTY